MIKGKYSTSYRQKIRALSEYIIHAPKKMIQQNRLPKTIGTLKYWVSRRKYGLHLFLLLLTTETGRIIVLN